MIICLCFHVIESAQPEITIWNTVIPDNNGDGWNFDSDMKFTDKTHVSQSCPGTNEPCWQLSDGHFVEKITNVSVYRQLRLQYNLRMEPVQSSSDHCQWYYGIDPTRNLEDTDCDNCTVLEPSITLQQDRTYTDISIDLPLETYYSDYLILYFESEGDVDCYLNGVSLFGKLHIDPTDYPTPEPSKVPTEYTPSPIPIINNVDSNESATQENESGSGSGATIGGVIGGVCLCCCIVTICGCTCGSRRRGPYWGFFNKTAHGPDLSEERFRYECGCWDRSYR